MNNSYEGTLHKQAAVDCFSVMGDEYLQVGEVVNKMVIEKGHSQNRFHDKIREKTVSSQLEKEKFTSVVVDTKKRPVEESPQRDVKKKKE